MSNSKKSQAAFVPMRVVKGKCKEMTSYSQLYALDYPFYSSVVTFLAMFMFTHIFVITADYKGDKSLIFH